MRLSGLWALRASAQKRRVFPLPTLAQCTQVARAAQLRAAGDKRARYHVVVRRTKQTWGTAGAMTTGRGKNKSRHSEVQGHVAVRGLGEGQCGWSRVEGGTGGRRGQHPVKR